jgi:hypothetical protein
VKKKAVVVLLIMSQSVETMGKITETLAWLNVMAKVIFQMAHVTSIPAVTAVAISTMYV